MTMANVEFEEKTRLWGKPEGWMFVPEEKKRAKCVFLYSLKAAKPVASAT